MKYSRFFWPFFIFGSVIGGGVFSRMIRICVVDGKGGGIGATLIKYIRDGLGNAVELIAMGTNAIATARMLKAGANDGASGENAICHTVAEADYIVGTVSIMLPNAMLGEVTPMMAAAISSSSATKILLPLSQERIVIVGADKEPLPHLGQSVVDTLKEVMNHV